MNLLEGLRIATTALNLPGPVACARLRDLGAAVVKVEPPAGDPFEAYCPAWYGRLHERMEVRRLDLKSAEGREAMDALLAGSDLLVTAQRPSALARMGLGGEALSRRFPRLCRVNITGHAPPHEETPGHDLTYMAAHGLVTPGVMPPTLFADMAGAERAVSTALALVIGRDRGGAAAGAAVPLEEAAAALAQPLREGLTRRSALLGGGLAGYNLYATSDGWIALAALEPHFAESLSSALGIDSLTAPRLEERFSAHTAAHWERWARERGLPLVALRDPSNPSGH
ncbi:MAG TPA: CoA transferase [Usitatibacter sp.]|nr:CoA transferase [Usitatibacter sp.]